MELISVHSDKNILEDDSNVKVEFEVFPRDRSECQETTEDTGTLFQMLEVSCDINPDQKCQEKGLTSLTPTHVITIQRCAAVPPDNRIIWLIDGPVVQCPP